MTQFIYDKICQWKSFILVLQVLNISISLFIKLHITIKSFYKY